VDDRAQKLVGEPTRLRRRRDLTRSVDRYGADSMAPLRWREHRERLPQAATALVESFDQRADALRHEPGHTRRRGARRDPVAGAR
jgi:hypothetical protein